MNLAEQADKKIVDALDNSARLNARVAHLERQLARARATLLSTSRSGLVPGHVRDHLLDRYDRTAP